MFLKSDPALTKFSASPVGIFFYTFQANCVQKCSDAFFFGLKVRKLPPQYACSGTLATHGMGLAWAMLAGYRWTACRRLLCARRLARLLSRRCLRQLQNGSSYCYKIRQPPLPRPQVEERSQELLGNKTVRAVAFLGVNKAVST